MCVFLFDDDEVMVKSTYITLYIYMYKNVHIYVLFNLAFSREFYGGVIILNILRNFILHMVFSSRKLKHATTCCSHSPPPNDGNDNSLIPLTKPNRLPFSQFLPDWDGSSGKTYLQPSTNTLIT